MAGEAADSSSIMPFKSEAQRRFMYANHPDIAARWSKEYPNQGKLPKHVSKKLKKLVGKKKKHRGK